MGDAFLKHIERTRILLHLIDASNPERDLYEAYLTINHELGAFNPKLLKKELVRASSRNTIAHGAAVSGALPRQAARTVRARPARENDVQVPTHNGELVGFTSFLTYAATWRQRSERALRCPQRIRPE